MNGCLTECPPIIIFGFARPGSLRLVFDRVREARPSKLFIVLDYPREGRVDDLEGWTESKKIFEGVDWSCEVKRNYATKNMGCRDRIQSGLSWAFEHVDRLMILEDDCVPDPTFFRFCGDLLERYKDDTRVGMIAGCDEHFHVKEIDYFGDSYYFDRFSSIWGWATWRRAWLLNDTRMTYWPEFKKRFELMDGVFRNKLTTRYFKGFMNEWYLRTSGTWDGVWQATMYRQSMLCIHPTVNLISNYGCGVSSREESRSGATRCAKRSNPWDRRPTVSMKFPLIHPMTMMPHIISERQRFLDAGEIKPWWRWLVWGLKRKLRCMIKAVKK